MRRELRKSIESGVFLENFRLRVLWVESGGEGRRFE